MSSTITVVFNEEKHSITLANINVPLAGIRSTIEQVFQRKDFSFYKGNALLSEDVEVSAALEENATLTLKQKKLEGNKDSISVSVSLDNKKAQQVWLDPSKTISQTREIIQCIYPGVSFEFRKNDQLFLNEESYLSDCLTKSPDDSKKATLTLRTAKKKRKPWYDREFKSYELTQQHKDPSTELPDFKHHDAPNLDKRDLQYAYESENFQIIKSLSAEDIKMLIEINSLLQGLMIGSELLLHGSGFKPSPEPVFTFKECQAGGGEEQENGFFRKAVDVCDDCTHVVENNLSFTDKEELKGSFNKGSLSVSTPYVSAKFGLANEGSNGDSKVQTKKHYYYALNVPRGLIRMNAIRRTTDDFNNFFRTKKIADTDIDTDNQVREEEEEEEEEHHHLGAATANTKDMKPKSKLQSECDAAIDEEDQLLNVNKHTVRKFLKTFGDVVMDEVLVGGKLFDEGTEDSQFSEGSQSQSKELEGGLGGKVWFVSLEASYSQGHKSKAKDITGTSSTGQKTQARGGQTTCAADPSNWLTSLAKSRTWRIIQVLKRTPTHEFIENERVRQKVAAVIYNLAKSLTNDRPITKLWIGSTDSECNLRMPSCFINFIPIPLNKFEKDAGTGDYEPLLLYFSREPIPGVDPISDLSILSIKPDREKTMEEILKEKDIKLPDESFDKVPSNMFPDAREDFYFNYYDANGMKGNPLRIRSKNGTRSQEYIYEINLFTQEEIALKRMNTTKPSRDWQVLENAPITGDLYLCYRTSIFK